MYMLHIQLYVSKMFGPVVKDESRNDVRIESHGNRKDLWGAHVCTALLISRQSHVAIGGGTIECRHLSFCIRLLSVEKEGEETIEDNRHLLYTVVYDLV
jgi:hypothetical protein